MWRKIPVRKNKIRNKNESDKWECKVLNETRLGGIKIGGRIIIRELNATSATEAQRPQRGCDGNLVCDINP